MRGGFEDYFTDELLEHLSIIRARNLQISADEMQELLMELDRRGLTGLSQE